MQSLVSGLGLAALLLWPAPGRAAIALGAFDDPSGVSGFAAEALARFNFSEWPEEGYRSIPAYSASADPAFDLDGRRTYVGITGVTWFEDKDKPCNLKLEIDALNAEVRRDAHLPLWVNRKYGEGERDAKDLCQGSPGNEKTATLLAGQFLRGIAVCTTDKKDSDKDRIKGLRLFGATIDAAGRVTAAEGSPREVRHTNCARWHPPVKCAAGQIAIGLRIHHSDGAYTGLGLKCRAVETAPSPYAK